VSQRSSAANASAPPASRNHARLISRESRRSSVPRPVSCNALGIAVRTDRLIKEHPRVLREQVHQEAGEHGAIVKTQARLTLRVTRKES
jgi:hypothetical protein